MVVDEIGVVLYMKNFRFNTIEESQELQIYKSACRFIGKSAVIKCHQLLFKKLLTGNRFSTS